MFGLFKKKTQEPDPDSLYRKHLILMEIGATVARSGLPEFVQRRGWSLPDPTRCEEALSVIAPMLVLNGMPHPDLVGRLAEPYQLLYVAMLQFFEGCGLDAELPPEELRGVKIAAWAFVHMRGRPPEDEQDWDFLHFLKDMFTTRRAEFLKMADEQARRVGWS